MELIILKLGGSVITEKNKPHSFNRSLMEEIAEELAKINAKLILIHGAGGFGHPLAKQYAIHKGYRDRTQLKGVTETKRSMLNLTMTITEILAEHNVPVFPFLSSSCMVARSGRLKSIDLIPIKIMLDLGLVPLCSGDVIADLKTGFTIISGDQIAICLAEKLKASRVIFGCDVNGVFTSDPNKNPDAKLIEIITPKTLKKQIKSLGESTNIDVTKGMLGKITESSKFVSRGREVVLINLQTPKNLTRLIKGDYVPCTRFIAD